MGWGQGMGIGWSTTPNGGANTFTIRNCEGTVVVVYSNSPQFLPDAYVYTNPDLTHPFTPGSGNYWNLPELINTIGGYEVSNTTGAVKSPLFTCPV